MHVCVFFLRNKICHTGERCDLSNLAHIYLFYSYTDVEFTRGHSEMLLLPVPFELCMCPDKCFFLVEDLGRKKSIQVTFNFRSLFVGSIISSG